MNNRPQELLYEFTYIYYLGINNDHKGLKIQLYCLQRFGALLHLQVILKNCRIKEFSKYKERRAEKQVPFQPGRGFLIPQR